MARSTLFVVTTPYVLLEPGVQDWMTYFDRALAASERVERYGRHMKYGPTREYWTDFIFEAFVGHQLEAIFLAGLPDVHYGDEEHFVNTAAETGMRPSKVRKLARDPRIRYD